MVSTRGICVYLPSLLELSRYGRCFCPGDENVSSPFEAGPQRWSGRRLLLHAGSMIRSQSTITQWGGGFHTLRSLHFCAPANQRSAGRVGISTPLGAVLTREIAFFIPMLSELWMYGGFYDPGMGIYHPPVRRDRGVSPRATSASLASPPDWREAGVGGALGQ